jgi:hypothetical protein
VEKEKKRTDITKIVIKRRYLLLINKEEIFRQIIGIYIYITPREKESIKL